MAYNATFKLESVKVNYTSAEDGEYTFRLYYDNRLVFVINTPEDVEDGSIWRDTSSAHHTTSDLKDDQFFKLVFESQEYDEFRGGDDIGRVERLFGINNKGNFTIPLEDDGDNTVEFNISISIQPVPVLAPPPPPKDTVRSLRGIRAYENRKYNANSGIIPGITQNFDVGSYDLPYRPVIMVGGRFPFPVQVIGIQPDSISSLKIGTNYFVDLYDQFGQKGEVIRIDENTPIMPPGWDNRVKSIGVFDSTPIEPR